MQASLSRRKFFKFLGAAGAVAAVPSSLLARSPADQAAQTQTDAAYQFFTEPEAAFVTAAVDRLIPADEQWPSASQAGVVNFLDLQLSGAYGSGNRLYRDGPWQPGTPQQGYQLPLTPAELYRISIAAIDAKIREAYEGKSFAALPGDEQDAILQALESGRFPLDELPAPVFFETLLANTVEGFFSDPIYGGNKNMAGWRMIGFPGAYAQWVFEVDDHGKQVNRPPLSIGQSHSHR